MGVVSGKLDIGIAQSAVLYEAANGLREWEPYGRMRNLRSIVTLFTKSLTIVAREDAGILTVRDLQGKTINIGESGTGTNANSRQLLTVLESKHGVRPGRILEVSNEEALALFRDGGLDAIVTNLSHPAPYLKDVLNCGTPGRFVEIDFIRDFTRQYPSYVEGDLPARLYPDAVDSRDMKVIATPTVLFTHDGMSRQTIRSLVSEIIVNLREIRRENPELESLEAEGLLADAVLPAHPGAIDAFYEAGVVRAKPKDVASPLMAISLDRHDPLSAKIAEDLSREANARRLADLRLVVLMADSERESIYRVVSGTAHCGFANAAELYAAWNGTNFWSQLEPLQNLASLARVYDVAVVALVPRSHKGHWQSLRPVVPRRNNSGRSEALHDLLATMRPAGSSPVEVLSEQDAFAAYAAGDAALLLSVELHEYERSGSAAEFRKRLVDHLPDSLRKTIAENGGLEGLLQPVLPEEQALKRHPWFEIVSVPIAEWGVERTAVLPMIFFSSLRIPSSRLLPTLDSLLAGSAKNHPVPLHQRLGYLAKQSPIPFHPAVDEQLGRLLQTHPELKSFSPGHLPTPAVRNLTIAAPKTVSGNLLAAGLLSFVLSRTDVDGSTIAYCSPSVNEREALEDVNAGRRDFAIVSATQLYEAAEGLGAWQGKPLSSLRVVGGLHTVSLAFYGSPVDAPPNPRLRDYIGRRISAPEPTVRMPERGLSITIFNLDRFESALANRTLINAEESGMADALRMYNEGTIHGFFVVALHPSERLASGIERQRAGQFVPITEGYDFVIAHPYYVNTVLPAKLLSYYPLSAPPKANITSIGVPMMLVANESVDKGLVQRVLQAINSDVAAIRETHPSFSEFTPNSLLNGFAVAPLHDGARTFYESQGLITTPGSQGTTISMGTGSRQGSFFRVGAHLERCMNAHMQKTDAAFRVAMEITDGSHENCLAVNDRAFHLGISQADFAYHAAAGTAGWNQKPLTNLRAVCNLHPIPLLLLVRPSVQGDSLKQLSGITLNIGTPGSGTRVLADIALQRMGINLSEQKLSLREDADMVAKDKLNSGGLDALLVAIGHSEVMEDLVSPQNGLRLLPIEVSDLEDAAGVVRVTLSPKDLPGIAKETQTIAARATLLTYESAEPEIIYEITRAILEWRERINPVPQGLAGLHNEDLCRDLVLPLHEGARRAYEEAGLLATPAADPEGRRP